MVNPIEEGNPISAQDRQFRVFVKSSRNRHSYARIKDGAVLISVPERLRGKKREETVHYLHLRMERLLRRHPGRFTERRIEFSGECVSHPLGVETTISTEAVFSEKPHYSIHERESSKKEVRISLPGSLHGSEYSKTFNLLATRAISELSIAQLSAAVERINKEHFGERLGKIRIRRSRSIWGSISRDRNMTINFSLLYVPDDMLEYVVVHELSHIRNRRHDKRFWESVEEALPDYKERRAWLREHSSLMG